MDANRRLGFKDDQRTYDCVEFILRDMGIKVSLSSNHAAVLTCDYIPYYTPGFMNESREVLIFIAWACSRAGSVV